MRVNYTTPMCFETKYILRMIDAILANCQRGERATTKIHPWVTLFEHDNNRPPTMKEIQKKFSNEGPIDVFLERLQ